MSTINFSFEWEYKGRRRTAAIWHENLKSKLRDWRRAWRRVIAEVLEPYIGEQFSSEGQASEGAPPWAGLAESTVRHREYPNNPILFQSGKLLGSFFSGPGHIEEVGDQEMVWGSAVPYALYHQTGAGVGYNRFDPKSALGPGRGMPRRPLLYFPLLVEGGKARNRWIRKLNNIFRAEARNQARDAGFETMGPGERGMPGAPSRALEIGEAMLSEG